VNLKTLGGEMMMYKKTINEKKKCYKRLHHNRSNENIQKYKEARRNAKKVMSEAKSQAYTELYQKLDTKEGENDVYKVENKYISTNLQE
jgi:hypothetical protein